ncbi:MAG: hypothetical protein IJS60_05610 [Abditibacteriota bacterium]|nr:hypothetical protein [Abditibacteriota bacterium]
MLIFLGFFSLFFLSLSISALKKIVFMLIDNEISAIQSLWYFGGYFTLLFLYLEAPPDYFFLRILIILIIVSFIFLIDPIKNSLDDYDMDKQYIRKIDGYRKVVAKNPKDWGTLSEIAYCYYKLQKYDQAIEVQKQVVFLSRGDITETGKLSDYEKHSEKVKHPGVKCWFCGRMVPEKDAKCPYCHRAVLSGESIRYWLKNLGYRELIIKVIAGAALAFICAILMNIFHISISFLINFIIVVLIFGYVCYMLLKTGKDK